VNAASIGFPSSNDLKAETAHVSTPPPTVFRFLYRSRQPSSTWSAARLLRWRDYPCQPRGAQLTRRGLLRANRLAAILVTEITNGDGESSTGIGKTKSYAVDEGPSWPAAIFHVGDFHIETSVASDLGTNDKLCQKVYQFSSTDDESVTTTMPVTNSGLR
jgi:hypothetical protein